jgi:hypothetical protein
VGGPAKLPLNEIFESVGITYIPEQTNLEYTTGLETKAMKVIDYEGKKVFQISDTAVLNNQGRALKFLKGDILFSINGNKIPDMGPEIQPYFEKVKTEINNNPTITYEVFRESENNEIKKINLEAPVKQVERKKKHVLEFNQDANAEQLALRESWLGSR